MTNEQSTDAADQVAATAKAIKALVSQEWHNFTDPIAQIGQNTAGLLLHPEDARARHEMYRSLLAQLAAGFFAQLNADPQYPDFWPMYSSAFNSQAPNPDNSHYLTPIDDNGVYKISGFRGTVKRVSFSVGTGTLYTKGNMEGGAIKSLGEYDLDDLPLGSDGAFDVILSPEPPAGHTGPWWKLGSGATNILVRQTSYDWVNEVDARLAIDRLDTPAAKPRPTAEELARRMLGLAQYSEFPVRVTIGYFNVIRDKFGFNQLGYIDNSGWAPVVAQKYAYAAFDIANDEALLIEATMPKKSRYWSIHLAEEIGATLDYVNRQTSLNGFTARTDSDGLFRTVISAQDPGVPNWLDTTGLRTGIIQARFEGCDTWPEFTTSVIKVADVRKHVPADTAVINAEQRDAAIRVRRKGAQMRKRW